MTTRLNRQTLARVPADVRRPDYDFSSLGIGIVHLGLGAFHRAHQAVFTEDAIRLHGGDWGILAVSLRHASIPDALAQQDHLYTVETLSTHSSFRIVGAIRASLAAPARRAELTNALASRGTHVITMTVTEKGYGLGPDGELDFTQADIAYDLQHPDAPRSTIGWLAYGLAARHRDHGQPITVVSCDNLRSNGDKLCRAVTTFVQRTRPELLVWLRGAAAFPQTVVDCIVPASTETSYLRVAQALAVQDRACVQREMLSQWVIEDRFVGPRPAWDRVGVQIVPDVGCYAQLKLHVLNACHSALAYLGMPRGYTFVREAIADPELASFLDVLVNTEIAAALAPIKVTEYWRTVRGRFAVPLIDHRLAQIAEDGSSKLAERIFPLMITNAGSGAPLAALARIVRAWLTMAVTSNVSDPQRHVLNAWGHAGSDLSALLDDPALFPLDIRSNSTVRSNLLGAAG